MILKSSSVVGLALDNILYTSLRFVSDLSYVMKNNATDIHLTRIEYEYHEMIIHYL